MRLRRQKCEVSIFIVIFSTLLITIVVISFVRIMIQGQQQATAYDLSQSAYDSAQAGVEDAKRAIARYVRACKTGTPGDCVAFKNQLNSTQCNRALSGLVDVDTSSNNEVLVQENGTSNELDQAYTCVKITTETDDYKNSLTKDEAKIIPLVGVSNFDSVKIEWFNNSDLNAIGGTAVADVPSFGSGVPLLGQTEWNAPSTPNRPPIIRAQLIQYQTTGIFLSDFNNNGPLVDTNTLFLYPTNIVSPSLKFDTNDIRRRPVGGPIAINCPNLNVSDYACSATVRLAKQIVGNDRVAYLRLTSLYRNANIKVTLLNGSSIVRFDDVQPQVDSTGRANDLFRRVQTRVELIDQAFSYPDAEMIVDGNFCKNFFVTDSISEYSNSCTP